MAPCADRSILVYLRESYHQLEQRKSLPPQFFVVCLLIQSNFNRNHCRYSKNFRGFSQALCWGSRSDGTFTPQVALWLSKAPLIGKCFLTPSLDWLGPLPSPASIWTLSRSQENNVFRTPQWLYKPNLEWVQCRISLHRCKVFNFPSYANEMKSTKRDSVYQ